LIELKKIGAPIVAQVEESRHIGHWLFRWRSFLPLLTISMFLITLINYTYPKGSFILDILWEIFCFTISFLGLGIRIYTVGHTPKGTSGRNTKSQKAYILNTTGMYSLVRHPLYVGNFLIWLGITCFPHSLFFSLVAILLFFLYYKRIIFVEEEFLRERFGQTFIEWAEKTPVMFPRLKNWQKPSLPFSLKTVLKREHTGFFVIMTSFTCMEVVGDLFYKGKWQISWFYCLLFGFGLATYIVLLTLKKKHLLYVEGR
jgi:protein-S-isoprenylcysteine O-methyltransferase Ste14